MTKPYMVTLCALVLGIFLSGCMAALTTHEIAECHAAVKEDLADRLGEDVVAMVDQHDELRWAFAADVASCVETTYDTPCRVSRARVDCRAGDASYILLYETGRAEQP